MPNRRILLLFSLLAAATVACSAAGRRAMVGGYSPVKNLNDQHLTEIAQFAVGEYNKQNGGHLQLVKIVKAESQVVAGTNYRFVLAANDNHNYEAVVYDIPWRHTRSLTSFKPV